MFYYSIGLAVAKRYIWLWTKQEAPLPHRYYEPHHRNRLPIGSRTIVDADGSFSIYEDDVPSVQ